MTTQAQNRISHIASRDTTVDGGLASLMDQHRLHPVGDVEEDAPSVPTAFETYAMKPNDVYEEVRRQLPWEFASEALVFTSARRVERKYDKAYSVLNDWKSRTVNLVWQVVRNAPNVYTNLQRGTKQEEEARQAIEAQLHEYSEYHGFDPGHLPPPRSLALSASLDKHRLHRAYNEHFHHEIDSLVRNLFTHLEQMQQRGIVGTAHYGGKGRNLHCQFTTFHSAARRVEGATDTLVSQSRSVSPGLATTTTTTRTTTSGSYRIQHVHSAYLLREVTRTPLTQWCKPVPGRVARIIRSLPPYLVPFMTITDGVQRDGISVAKDVAEIPWSYTHEQVTVRHDPTYDPFLSLGSFVLAYWTDWERKLSKREWNEVCNIIGK